MNSKQNLTVSRKRVAYDDSRVLIGDRDEGKKQEGKGGTEGGRTKGREQRERTGTGEGTGTRGGIRFKKPPSGSR